MTWTSHLSVEPSLAEAVDACSQACLSALGGRADLVFAFVSIRYGAEARHVPSMLSRYFPDSVRVGCSGGGIIGAGHETEGIAAVSITAARLPGVHVHAFHRESEELPDLDGPASAWEAWVGVPAADRPAFILLPDPFSCDVESLLLGLDYAYPGQPKVGGLASGSHRPGEQMLFHHQEAHRSGVVGVALHGDIQVNPLVAQGCRPIGPPLVVTDCLHNVVMALNRETPLSVLRNLLPTLDDRDRALAAQALFLGLASETFQEEAGDCLIRNVLGIDQTRGSMAVGALLRPGQRVQFHLRDAVTSAEDLQRQCERYRDGAGPPVEGALLFSCLGRGRHLYGRIDHDTRLFTQVVGQVPVGGFFCSGEIGPVAHSTYVHGYTSAFALFSQVGPRG